MQRLITFLLFGMFSINSFGIEHENIPNLVSMTIELDSSQGAELNQLIQDQNYTPKHRKLKAALLAVFLGPFGVHRIYLGTTANVPVVYSLTLGGLGILPIIDLISILTTKKLERYMNQDRVIMWTTSSTNH